MSVKERRRHTQRESEGYLGGTMVPSLAPSLHSNKVLSSNLQASWGLTVWCLCVCVGSHQVLWLPPKVMHVRLIGDSKLVIGVNDRLVCYANPVRTGDRFRVHYCFCSVTARIGQPPQEY